MPAMVTFAVIPSRPGMQIADLNIGVLFVLSIASLGVYGITLGGWASNSEVRAPRRRALAARR